MKQLIKDLFTYKKRPEEKLIQLEKNPINLSKLSNDGKLQYLLLACKAINLLNIKDDELNLKIIHNLATYASRTNS